MTPLIEPQRIRAEIRAGRITASGLQSLFGIITPSGLHFERHHQGWWDIDPRNHRLMVNGSDDKIVKTPMVFTMDDLMRLPSVSRFHPSATWKCRAMSSRSSCECRLKRNDLANTPLQWGDLG